MIKGLLVAGTMLGATLVGSTMSGYTAVEDGQNFEPVQRYEVTAQTEQLTEAIAIDDINEGISYPAKSFEELGLDLEEGDVIEITWQEDAFHNGTIIDDFVNVEVIEPPKVMSIR